VDRVKKNIDDAGKCSFDITPEYTGNIEMERYLSTGFFG